ncbi:MAG: DUF732 domain-containing protein [Actinomycetia bacterium]|nr:DUF732 domain-containing protein [Actinomycetes bacterium]
MYCVYCGTTVGQALSCAQCGAHRVGASWEPAYADPPTPQSGGRASGGDQGGQSGWQPDPTGRHEGRYFVGGQPTDLIRDGGVESIDPEGEGQITQRTVSYPPDPPSVVSSRPRRRWLSAAVIGLLLALGAGGGIGIGLLLARGSVDDKYLEALRGQGLAGQFASDANAIAHAKQVCRSLEEGDPQRGMPTDRVAVDAYCPQFSEGFHVLETATIDGTFTLGDDSPNPYFSAIETDGSNCSGVGPYSDIHAGTQVFVKNKQGDVLTTSELLPGKGTRYRCTFDFSFDVTEGEDHYIVSVGRRGELSYTFTELKSRGVTLGMG